VSADGDPVSITLKELRAFLSSKSQSFSELETGMPGGQRKSNTSAAISGKSLGGKNPAV